MGTFSVWFYMKSLFFFCVPDMTLQDLPALNVSVLQILVFIYTAKNKTHIMK